MLPVRLPLGSDFPPSLNPIFHPSNASLNTVTNIILFLPGLGDTSTNFSAFPSALNLPDTLTITLQPPFPLPHGLTPTPSYHWADDLAISSTGTLDGVESGLERATKLVADVVVDVLVDQCGFGGERIQLFGYGQGGCLAISVPLDERLRGAVVLGGVVSVGGPLPLRTKDARVGRGRCGTPVLVCGGTGRELFGEGAGESREKRLRDRYEVVEMVRWKKRDDGLPKSREEVLPLMRFWGRTSRSQRGVPEGAIEVG